MSNENNLVLPGSLETGVATHGNSEQNPTELKPNVDEEYEKTLDHYLEVGEALEQELRDIVCGTTPPRQ